MNFAALWAGFYIGAVGTALATALVRERRFVARAKPSVLEDMLLVRPCAGDEPGLADRLATTGGARNVVIAIRDPSDKAFSAACVAAHRLRRKHVHVEIVLTRARGANQKAAQLARVLARRSAQIVAVADSDVELPEGLFGEMVGELSTRGLGAIWAPFVLAHPEGIGGAVLNGSLHALPLLAGLDPGGFVGKVFVVRGEALAAAGGFDAVRDRLGEDVALARRMRAAGHPTGASRARVEAHGRADADRFTRWALVVRSERPLMLAGYPLFLAATPLAVLLAILGREPLTIAAAGVVLFARLVVWFAVTPRASLLAALGADFLLLYAAVRALVWPRTTWCGRALRLGRGGRLVSEEAREEREEALRESSDGPRSRSVREDEAGGVLLAPDGVDPRELAPDGVGEVASLEDRWTDGDPQLGLLLGGEDEAARERNDRRARESRDGGRPGTELERAERRALSTLGIDPHDAPRTVEELRGVADGARAVASIGEVDPERADLAEEGKSSEIRRIHHREGLRAKLSVSEPERDERIPPGRVVRDDEDGTGGDGVRERIEPRDPDASERAEEARPRVPREQADEPADGRRGDQAVASNDNASGSP